MLPLLALVTRLVLLPRRGVVPTTQRAIILTATQLATYDEVGATRKDADSCASSAAATEGVGAGSPWPSLAPHFRLVTTPVPQRMFAQ